MRTAAYCCACLVALTVGVSSSSCSRTGLLTEQAAIQCTEGTAALSRAYPTVLFVLDRSRSMSTEMGSSSNQVTTRWQALGSALAATLPSIDTNVQVGALLFPEGGDDNGGGAEQCSVSSTVAVKPALGNVPELLTLVENSSVGGATPTADAIEQAGKAVLSVRTSKLARALVLATDGGPDCNGDLNAASCRCVSSGNTCHSATRCLDDERTIERIKGYAARSLPTYVIGIQSEGDTQFSDVLEAMAVAGERPQKNASQSYYAARSETELNLALSSISKQVGSCLFLTESVPDEGGTIELLLDGTALNETQWSWQDRANGEIVLGSELCSQVLTETTPKLVARVTCAEE